MPQTRLCAFAWASRRWTRCATTSFSSASCRTRARGRPTSMSISRPVGVRRLSGASMTSTGATARHRSLTSSPIDHVRRCVTRRGRWDTRRAARRRGRGERGKCQHSLATPPGPCRACPGTWVSIRAAWCSPTSRSLVSVRWDGLPWRDARCCSGIRRIARTLVWSSLTCSPSVCSRRCASPLTNYKLTTFERMDRRIHACAGGHHARCVDAGISLWGCIPCQKKTCVSTTCSAPPTPWVCFRSSRARR